jgi:hypothetical protein
MMAFLDASISTHSLIWLFLAAFMLHDFEEIIRIDPWFQKNTHTVLEKLPQHFHKDFSRLSSMTTSQFSVAVLIEFIIFIPVTFLAAERESYLLFTGYNVILMLHVFMHIGQALYVKMLVPGVVTAVLITFPYSIYLLYRMLDENLISMTDILLSVPLGLTLIPIVWFGHKAGEKLVPHNK